MTPDQAVKDHATVMTCVLRMLCVGLVHGDLSEFNVLQNEEGPVIIDLPQAVNAAGNNNAKSMPASAMSPTSPNSMRSSPPSWQIPTMQRKSGRLYEEGRLAPNLKLTGQYEFSTEEADVDAVLHQIHVAYEEEKERQEALRAN